MGATFIHTADLHLGLKFNNKRFSIKEREKRRIELWKTFDKIVEIAYRERIKYLFISGDLVEEDYCKFGDIKRIASRLAEIKETRVIITTGNHDPYDDNSMYNFAEWSENVYFIRNFDKLEKLDFEDDNICIYSLSWNKKEQDKERDDIYKTSVDKNKINILLLHCDVLDKKSNYFPVDKMIIKNMFDYCALGHIHKYTEVEKNIVYPGTPEPLDFGETGAHGIIKGILNKNNIIKEFIPISERKFVVREINIEPEYHFNKILDLIKYSGETLSNTKNYIKIKLKGIVDKDISIEELKNEAEQFFYYIEFEDDFSYELDMKSLADENKGNLIEEYVKQLESVAKYNNVAKEALKIGLEALLRERVVK